MAKGDIVLIPFPFTDLSGSKLRPAVILAEANLDLTVCFITSKTKSQEMTDVRLFSSSTNGLKTDSVVRISKIATLDKSLVQGLLGVLTQSEISAIDLNLKLLFQLP